MCYSAQIARRAEVIATREGLPYEEVLNKIWSGFDDRWTAIQSRPYLPIVASEGRAFLASWTFLGDYIKDGIQANTMMRKTGNAAAEDMFTTPTFKNAARFRRGLLPVRAYYEFQHRGSKTVAFRFFRPDHSIFFIGCIYQEWQGIQTVAVCTMPPTALATWIHNSPDTYRGPRQPVIPRTDEEYAIWKTGGGPETIEDILQVREDGYIVAQMCSNSVNKRLPKLPPEPVGRPDGVLDGYWEDEAAS